MKKFFLNQQLFIVLAIVIGFFLNQTNCVADQFCDPDPLYGGCPSSCDFGTFTQWLTKSLGIWILLNIGGFFGKENLKKGDNLKDYLNQSGLRTVVRSINKEWKMEDREHKKYMQKLLKSMKSKS